MGLLDRFPRSELLGIDAALAREELAERGCVGEVEAVGYLGDAQLGGLQQEGGFHQ